MNKNILFAGILAFMSTSAALAQSAANDKAIILLGAQSASLNYTDTTFYVPVKTNQELEVSASGEWVKPSLANGKLKVEVQSNMSTEGRMAEISVKAKSGKMTRTFTIEQKREALADYVPSDYKIKVADAVTDNEQPGESIKRSIDGDMNTLWHSRYGNSNEDYFPITATYKFKDVDRIDYLRYYPRSSGGANGNFKKLDILYRCKGETEFTKFNKDTLDFGGKGTPTDIVFEGGLKNPEEIKFIIYSGAGDGQGFASCAEMEFYKKRADDPNVAIFGDEAWTSLKEGITQEDIDALTNPYCKFVAQQLLNDKDFTKGRVQDYTCRMSPEKQSQLWNSPGKFYDHFQGVTGININKGVHGIAVSGLPEGQSLVLKVVAWFAKELDASGKGGGPAEYTYVLHNGINRIEYKSDYDGLAYIAYYYDDEKKDSEKYPDVKVHFINGQVNGYLTPKQTNEELDKIVRQAKNRCIDLVGDKVHSVWQSAGVRDYCKASDGTSLGYVQYMNLLDSLVAWEHKLLGLEKYKRLPDNRTMAYVNYTYYMFQGGYGVSFMYDQERRVLNCKTLMYHDSDAIWGLSHEWGHQHQMTPYFCWTGQSECTNNMNSCYNVLHMGYTSNQIARIQDKWNSANDKFFEQLDATYNADARQSAFEKIDRFSWNTKVQDEIRRQQQQYSQGGTYKIPSINKDKEHALSMNEVNVEEHLAPLFMLYCYFSNPEHEGYTKDFQQDLYEALRQTDDKNGSVIEKKDGVDKYELLASVQNGNKNKKFAEFKQKYPESCWIKNAYVKEGLNYTQNSVPFIFNYIRKASRLCGYNLFDYFDKFGFMRTVMLTVDDYGLKDYAMMADMKEEFKKDMEALKLKPITEKMIDDISHSPIPTYETPVIPNEPVKK